MCISGFHIFLGAETIYKNQASNGACGVQWMNSGNVEMIHIWPIFKQMASDVGGPTFYGK